MNDPSPSDPVFDDQPRLLRAVRAFWSINPFVVLAVTFLLGAIPSVYASFASAIGNVEYYMPVAERVAGGEPCAPANGLVDGCIEKQVGYTFAVNWWPALVILFPLALFFAFDSVQAVQTAFARMRETRMFCGRDWEPTDTPGVQEGLTALVRQVWLVATVAGPVIVLVVVTTIALDWFCVVHLPLWIGQPLAGMTGFDLPEICANPDAQENDWSIAATFGPSGDGILVDGYRAPSWTSNYIFSAYVYALLMVEIAIILAYYCVILGLSIGIYGLQRGRFSIRIIPNVTSRDAHKRLGFESFEPVFRPCVFVTVFCFITAFLMRIQNEFLRRDDYAVVHEFLFEDIGNATRSLTEISIENPISAIMDTLRSLGRAIEVGHYSDPNSLLGAPLVIVVFALVSVALGKVLRDAARDACSSIQAALERPESAKRITEIYDLEREEIAQRLDGMKFWPLSWPRLRQANRMLLAGLFCFIFFRLALIWIGYVAVRTVQGKLSDDEEKA